MIPDEYVRTASLRKVRLLACALCRTVWSVLNREQRAAVRAAELYADGRLTKSELRAAWNAVLDSVPSIGHHLSFAAARCADDDEHVRMSPGIVCSHLEALVGTSLMLAAFRDVSDRVELPEGQSFVLCGDCGRANVAAGVRVCPGCRKLASIWGKDRCPWLTEDVLRMAHHSYEASADGRLDADALLVLSDSLEEAGCCNERLLRHLRGQELFAECEACARKAGTPVLCAECLRNRAAGWMPFRGPHYRGCWAVDTLLEGALICLGRC